MIDQTAASSFENRWAGPVPGFAGYGCASGLIVLAAGVSLGEGIALGGLSIIIVSVAIASIVSVINGKKASEIFFWSPAFSVTAAFIVWSLASYSWADLKPDSTSFSRIFDLLTVFFIAWAVFFTQSKGRRLAMWALVVFIAMGSALAILQHFRSMEFEELARYKIGFLRVMEPAPGGGFMAGGFLFHRLRLANLLAIAIPVMIFMVRYARGAFKVALAVSILFSIPALVFCFARTQLAAMFAGIIVTLGVMAATRWKSLGVKKLAAGAATLVVLIAIVAIMPGVRERYGQEGFSDRKEIWAASIDSIRESPFLGHGFGTAGVQLGKKLENELPGFSAYCHNQFLTVWLSLGVLGLLLWITFMMVSIYYAYKAMLVNPASAGLFSGLVTLQMISMFHDPFFHPVTGITYAAAASIAIVLGTKNPVQGEKRR